VCGIMGTCVNGPNGVDCPSNGADANCASGQCADGVCCTTACGGFCQACTAALKGYGADGTCASIAAGSDPQNECPGGNNDCNGGGVCGLGGTNAPCIPGAVDACIGPVNCPAGGLCP
jgi:hypothetical protein